jgi:glutamate-1-semialdehyde aminotransferase
VPYSDPIIQSLATSGGQSMSASAALLEAAADVIPGGVNTCRRRSEPRLCFRRGAGAYLEDLDGRRFVDYHAAYGAILLGHSHPAVVERVAAATRESVLFGVGVTEAEVALARKLAEHVPSIEQSVVCNSGSEATYHAIRLARGVTGRELIVKFQAATTASTTTSCATCCPRGTVSVAATRTRPGCSRPRSTRRSSAASTTSRTSSAYSPGIRIGSRR